MPKRKTLAIKFKYLGDVALAVPALRALREHCPDDELHFLVAEDAAALVANLPWLDRVWALPRTRGRMRWRESRPVIEALRRERFERSVDLVGNDRGAFLSRAAAARERLGVRPAKGFAWRRPLFHHTIEELDWGRHETIRNWHVLTAWDVPPPSHWALEVRPDPALRERCRGILPEGAVVAHLSTSQPKKEWPPSRWVRFCALFQEAFPRTPLVLSSGPSEREQALLREVAGQAEGVSTFPLQPGLAEFIAALAPARAFLSADTAPLHIAAGLDLPTLALFGASSAERWNPPGPGHLCLTGGPCTCSGHLAECISDTPCLAAIEPGQVLATLQQLLARAGAPAPS